MSPSVIITCDLWQAILMSFTASSDFQLVVQTTVTTAFVRRLIGLIAIESNGVMVPLLCLRLA